MDNITRRDAQLPYISDDAIFEEQKITRRLLRQFNTVDPSDFSMLQSLAKKIIPISGKNMMVLPPFYCDYGNHIKMGDHCFINYNCTILDVAEVIIGDNALFAPNVSIYTAGHPIHPISRNSGYEYGISVTIGKNVWLGGNVVITPGVTIGDNCVIGAGSVVTRDIPADTVAAGNPCKAIRNVTEEDKRYYYKAREFDEEAWGNIQKISKK